MASLRTSSYNFSDYLNLVCSNAHFIYCFSRNELYTLLFNVARPEHRKSKKLREKSKFQTNRLRFKISQAIHVQRTENRSCVKIQFWKTEIIPSALCFITVLVMISLWIDSFVWLSLRVCRNLTVKVLRHFLGQIKTVTTNVS